MVNSVGIFAYIFSCKDWDKFLYPQGFEELFYLLPNLRQIPFHPLRVLVGDDFQQLLQFEADVLHLGGGAGIEEHFLQQEVIFAEQAAGNVHVLLERGARRLLVLHDGGEDEGGHERDAERVGHRLVMFFKGVLEDVQLQRLVEVLEEDAAQVVALGDDDGVLVAQVAEAGEGGAEHGVGGDVAEAALFVEPFQPGLDGGDVADDAVLGQDGQHLAEGVEGVLHGHGVDDQLRLEVLDFVQRGEAVGVVHEAQLHGVGVVHGRFVLETQYVCKEGAHLAGSKDQYSHFSSPSLTLPLRGGDLEGLF